MDETKTDTPIYQEDDKFQAGVQIIKSICAREPYFLKGLIYFKEGEKHTFSFYEVPERLNGKPVNPVFTVIGEDIQDCLREIIVAIHEDDRQNGELNWRILPFNEKDLESLEHRLDSEGIWHEKTGTYFVHRRRPLTEYDRNSTDYTLEMEDLQRKKELAEMKAAMIKRFQKPANILHAEPSATRITAP